MRVIKAKKKKNMKLTLIEKASVSTMRDCRLLVVVVSFTPRDARDINKRKSHFEFSLFFF